MRRKRTILLILSIGGVLSVLFFMNSRQKVPDIWSEKEFIQVVTKHYMTEAGMIRSYGTEKNQEYLLESMGLYMEWLARHGQTDEWQKLTQVVESEFLAQNQEDAFLSWKVTEQGQAPVNAWIDDERILSVIGSSHLLYSKLVESIARHQVKSGLIVDFYDWKLRAASDKVVLSYGFLDEKLLPQQEMHQLYLKAASLADPFYPEFYQVHQKNFTKAEEVHMIDQLLIATELEKQSLSNESFWRWLVTEWQEKDKLHGKYDRDSLRGNNIESAAVYGYAARLAQIKGEEALYHSWKTRSVQLIRQHDFKDIHFFDLMGAAP